MKRFWSSNARFPREVRAISRVISHAIGCVTAVGVVCVVTANVNACQDQDSQKASEPQEEQAASELFVKHSWDDEKIAKDAIVAQVDAVPITFREVQNQLQMTLGKRPEHISKTQYARLQALALQQLVDQRTVIAYLRSKGLAATDKLVEVEIDRIKRRAESLEKSFDQFLIENNHLNETFERTISWQFSWRSYLESHLTDENLQKMFDADRRGFDGSKLKVAHVLLKLNETEDEQAWDKVEQAARDLAGKIRSGELEWNDVVKEHSAAASREVGGDIGWLENNGIMPEAFTAAAFKLKVGEISDPVRTVFGIHLIRCSDIETGTKRWTDCREELRIVAGKKLFDWVVDQYQAKVSIEFTGNSPYLEIGTGELKSNVKIPAP